MTFNLRVLAPVFATVAMAGSLSIHAAEPLRYVALVDGGKKAGEQVVTVGDDGVTRVEFVFKDNGRGPELKEQYTLNPDGTYRDYQVKGTATFGAKIDESFRVDDGKATWKSTSDQGSQKFEEGALYAPLAGTPQTATVTIAAMAKRPGMRLPLIPSGSLSQRTVDEVELTNSKGEKRKVVLLAMTGVGFTPQFAWATTDKNPRLFAFIFPGYLQLMEEGWEKSGDLLETRQKTAEGKALVELQKRLAHPLKGSTLIRNARVFDSEKGKLQKASDVLIRDGKIVSIVTTGGNKIASDHVVDAAGRTLLPGLFD
ncbi:MAG: amidohydrolase, partial [Dokdonella sp.]